ncbi:MAG: hypothetical protein ABSB69_16830 [Solirubrobacteraceae bacterium]|jgi:hypothetical protein
MPDEQPTIRDPAVQEPQTPAYEPIEEEEADEWLEEPDELELPARPRRRLLTPIPLALLGVLLIAGGFIAGVQVQKGQTSTASTGGASASLASRFAALGGGTSGTGKTPTGAAAGGFPGAGTGAGRPTSGTVAYLDGNTLYVTNSEGNTVKVKTSPSTSVTKTVKTKLKGIYPGETVTVTGAIGSNGTVSAESISVGSSGTGLAALLGGGGSGTTSSPSSSGSSALFGSG